MAGKPTGASEVADMRKRLKQLRESLGLSMRQLAKNAGVTVSYVSQVESGRISPTLPRLRNLLLAMNTDLGGFFAERASENEKTTFRRDSMQTISDEGRRYVFLLPRRPDMALEAVDEIIQPGDSPEFESLSSDIMGLVLEGTLALEIEDKGKEVLNSGDAFYVSAGKPLRGKSADPDRSVRILTVYSPPRY